MECIEYNCRIPVPHEHTGEMKRAVFVEWYCPSESRWVSCSDPCPDGRPHIFHRDIVTLSETIKMI